MALRFFNTLTDSLEDFKPLGKTVGLYTCGPTIYNYAHIGNFRAYCWEDILKKYLIFKGYKVKHVMNLTDVDDKTIKAANEEKMALSEHTEKYKKAFFDDIKTLNTSPADNYPAATQHIAEMVKLIQKLLDKGIAYRGDDGSIYYSVKKFKNYGKLAHIDVKKLKAGARISHDEYEKDSAADFVLWKAWDENDGGVFWETSLGKGRPGWHIECSAMSMKYLGESFDIHTGGVDNKFPHHENEIAQSEAATGKKFVKYWMHCEHLMVDGKKMSKSLGNFYTLRDLLERGLDSKAIRYTLINSQYRQPLNFTLASVKDSEKTIAGLQNLVERLKRISEKIENDSVKTFVDEAIEGFTQAMDDDLNVPKAMSFIFSFATKANKLLDENSIGAEGAKEALDFLKKVDSVLGVLNFEKKFFELDPKAEKLVAERGEARKQKDFAKADLLRKKLEEFGVKVIDNADGSSTAVPLE
ncbi:MAG: cysteine--tRNA ligase [Candidatus Diapherotrites archaeon]|nr:cysteine--tRNA ligase [Candidatus Diapherotrites archaeon]